jgi:hypothetical protein
MKTGFLTRLNILIASAVLTLTVGAANALSRPDMAPDRDNIPVELALVFMFLLLRATAFERPFREFITEWQGETGTSIGT